MFEADRGIYVEAAVAVESLLLNVVQSVEERSPRLEADAVGKLKVSVLPEPVMVKSVPVVEEASVTDGPVASCPSGPIPVSEPLPVPPPTHVPLMEKQPPFFKSIPLAYEVVVALSKKFQPVPLPPMDRSEPGVVVPMPTLPFNNV